MEDLNSIVSDNAMYSSYRILYPRVHFYHIRLKTYWRARKHLGFWVILLGIFVVHFVGAGYFYYAGNGLPLLVFGPTVAIEWALLALAVSWALAHPPQRPEVSCW
jgi:hypothetical protein